jgi:endonuclease/exonuclease/phosphatase family metal-dependent hydrolase
LAAWGAVSLGLNGCSSRSSSLNDAASGDFSPAQPPSTVTAPQRLKAVTFNLFNRPWQRGARLENAAATLHAIDADIVLLQEVAKGWLLGSVDPARMLAESLRMKYVRYWHEENLGVFRTGLAVLSRFPIVSSEYHEFKRHQFWDAKGYMRTTLELPGGFRLQVINLHMASTTNNEILESEWAELSEYVAQLQLQGPVLIGGDFNTEAANPALIKFGQQLKTSNLYEHEVFKDIGRWRSWTPSYRETIEVGKFSADSQLIDYFFAAPSATTAAGIANTLQFTGGRIVLPPFSPRPSDHLPVVAELLLAAPIRN